MEQISCFGITSYFFSIWIPYFETRYDAGEKRCRLELRAVWGDCDARVEAEDGTVLWENAIDEDAGIQEIDVEAKGVVTVVFSNRAFFQRRIVAVRAL